MCDVSLRGNPRGTNIGDIGAKAKIRGLFGLGWKGALCYVQYNTEDYMTK